MLPNPLSRLKSLLKRKAPEVKSDSSKADSSKADSSKADSYESDISESDESSQPPFKKGEAIQQKKVAQQYVDFIDRFPIVQLPSLVMDSLDKTYGAIKYTGLAILAIPFTSLNLSSQQVRNRMSFMHEVVSHAILFKEYHNRKRALLHNFAKVARKRVVEDSKLEEKIKERDEKQRMKALRENDMSAYTDLVKKKKDDRLQFLLDETDSLLSSLREFVEKQKAQVETFDKDYDNNMQDTGDLAEKDRQCFNSTRLSIHSTVSLSGATTKDYYKAAHQSRERLLVQPSMIVGGTMKPYQIIGLEWMVSLYNNRLSGILADEMGLGKTVQAISLLAHLMEKKDNAGPFLVCVPLSTLSNWANEFKRWAPTITVVQYKGTPTQRKDLAKKILSKGNYNVLLTTYDYTMKDKGRLSALKWQCIIIDEGHRLKNANSKFSLIMCQFQSRYRLLLTGTPLQNSLPELWSLLNFVLPKIFGSAESFEAWFSQPFAAFKGGAVDATGLSVGLNAEEKLVIINRLHAILRPFLLRRLKSQVLSQLPQKVEYVLRCELSAWQRLQYSQVQRFGAVATEPDHSLKTARGLQNLLMQLRKVCNHPFLMRNETIETFDINENPNWLWRSCGKLELLDRILPKLKAGGHRILIFSQMTRMLDILSDYLDEENHKYLRLDGSTNAIDREQRMELFNSENSPYFIFLLSTRAGGLGINLATADTVIIFDSDWNPTVDAQAMDRAHRIGQKKEVRVLRLITVSPIEEAIHSRATEKSTMENVVITAGKFEGGGEEKDEERTKFLESIIREELDTTKTLDGEDGEDVEQESIIPDAATLNKLIGRGDAEFALFQRMDAERVSKDRFEKKPWAAGIDGSFKSIESNIDATVTSSVSNETEEEAILRRAIVMDAEISLWTKLRLMGESEVPSWARLSATDQRAIKARRSMTTTDLKSSIVFKDISSASAHVIPEYAEPCPLPSTTTNQPDDSKRITRSRAINKYVDGEEEDEC
jgi:ATP-dependent helicase STH1/SNF2